MKVLVRFALAAGAAVGLSALVLPAAAGADPAPNIPTFAQGGDHALFVQTDNTAGNQVVAYHRNPNGTLAPAGTYATGGLGGVLNGSAVDHLASQGSLTYDAFTTSSTRSTRGATRFRFSRCTELSSPCAR